MRVKYIKNIAIGCALSTVFSQMPAYATNGYFLPGFGYRSQGMGGVGIAHGSDSLSTAANPANIINTGMRGDMGMGIFNPERSAAAGAGTGFAGGNLDSEPGGGTRIQMVLPRTAPLEQAAE